MRTISFYRQERMDGGIRTGIEIGSDTVLHRFENGGNDCDPALAWFVDVRCKGKRLPTESEPAREWFLRYAPLIKKGLRESAEELTAGIDINSWPLQRSISGPPGVRVQVVYSAIRRLKALEIAQILQDIADHWEERIRVLEEMDTIVH